MQLWSPKSKQVRYRSREQATCVYAPTQVGAGIASLGVEAVLRVALAEGKRTVSRFGNAASRTETMVRERIGVAGAVRCRVAESGAGRLVCVAVKL
jgi:hypothetical protein